jgi:hypothetical protein
MKKIIEGISLIAAKEAELGFKMGDMLEKGDDNDAG